MQERSETEVDGNIDLSAKQVDDQNNGTVRNSYPVIDSDGDNDDEFEDAQERPTQLLFLHLLLKPLLLFTFRSRQ